MPNENRNDTKELNHIIQVAINRRHDKFLSRSLKLMIWDTTVSGSYFFKRLFDIILSLLLLIILSPFLLLVCILIKIDSEGPIIYQSTRIGQYGRPFNFFKFRSMYTNAAEILEKMQKEAALLGNSTSQETQALSDLNKPKNHDPRLTRLGRFIRKASIDELPQLANVLLGDMSLVGPRPPTPEEVATYTLEQRKRLNIKPGITCIWQVTGRSDIPFAQQIELDKQYIANHNVLKDFWILLKTIPAVITGKGAY